MKVLIAGGGTGGHLLPALAIADALRANNDDVEPVLVGAQRGIEARLLPERNSFPFHLLPAEPFYRGAWWKNVKWTWLAWRLMAECRRILDLERPVFAIGTGGYAAGPMLYACVRRGIPIALQEQNAIPGVTTRWLARRAKQVHLGFPEARGYLRPGSQTEIFEFGNPISPPPRDRPGRAEAKAALGLDPETRVCFVTGGSQGSRAINRVVDAVLSGGNLSDTALLWSTGHAMWEQYRAYDDGPFRQVRAFWDPIAIAYAAADLAITRAGAMTTAELSAWGLPSILVPLPTAAADHQSRNAEALQRAGSAIHLPESELDPQLLVGRIEELMRSPARLELMAKIAIERSHPEAAERIAAQMMSLAE